MSNQNGGKEYKAYDYKQVSLPEDQLSFKLDCYENLGWTPAENISVKQEHGKILLRLKRDKNIINKTELTRLERNLESCFDEIDSLEQSKTKISSIQALTCGLIGTVFMAGATFAATASSPVVWLCVLLAIPGFLGWILPYFIYKKGIEKKAEKVTPFIETKQKEIEAICRKGCSLL